MNRFKRIVIGLACCAALVLGAGSSHAAGRAEEPLPVPPTPEVKVTIDGAYAGPGCTLGETSLPRNILNLLTPPDDLYFVLLDPLSCPSCAGTNAAILTSATVKLYFPVACSIPVKVSIVGTSGPGSCLVPDTSKVVCPPVTFNLAGTVGGQIYEFTLPMPDSTFVGKKFLQFNFFQTSPACSTISLRPRLVFGDPLICPLCSMYNLFVLPPAVDMCDPTADPLGRPIMYGTMASCFTPTLPTSWGSVKAIYR